MTYEEKYKQALERAKKLQETCDNTAVVGWCEYILPELKESEDERIRKAIHIYLDWLDGRKDYAPKGEYSIKDMIAWLEKQGEKKNTRKREIDDAYLQGICDAKHEIEKQGKKMLVDNVEPKFKVGDWVILPLGIIAHIDSLNSTDYQVTTTDGEIFDLKISKQDNYSLWNIQDAKDGDVLASGQVVFIFKVIRDAWLYCHCSAHNDGSFIAESYDMITCKYFGEVHPATEEQRDLLFEKMEEAGYEWDSDKKELKKKIESKKLDVDEVILSGWSHTV